MDQEKNYRHFYIDSNFFWVLCKDPKGEKIKNWNESLKQFKIVPNEKMVHFIGTPFMLLEAIGSPHRKIQISAPKIPEQLLKSGSIEELKKYLYDHAYNVFSGQQLLQPEEILEAVKKTDELWNRIWSKFF